MGAEIQADKYKSSATIIAMSILKHYQFTLPPTLIAQEPARPRDHARLLVYSLSDRSIVDTYFYDIGKYLPPGAAIVVNDSKVEHCRWLFDNGKTEVFVLEKNDPRIIRALVRPGKKFRLNQDTQLTEWLKVQVIAIDADGIRTLQLSVNHDDSRFKEFEHIPLPPYISQNDSLAAEYQTIYANPAGSLAAPTAGLHFTPTLLRRLSKKHDICKLTLHVGLGTFAKLTEEQISTGHLHEETFEIDKPTADILNKADHRTAVGTTTVRTLESVFQAHKQLEAERSTTDIFIRPGFHFQVVDSIVTNFHLPGTSLLMLVAAFLCDKLNISEQAAADELMRIYNYAVDKKYRFYSFGDAMLIV